MTRLTKEEIQNLKSGRYSSFVKYTKDKNTIFNDVVIFFNDEHGNIYEDEVSAPEGMESVWEGMFHPFESAYDEITEDGIIGDFIVTEPEENSWTLEIFHPIGIPDSFVV